MYAWNPDGTLQRKTDAKGQWVEYLYDGYKRVTRMRAYKPPAYPWLDPGLDQEALFTYDADVLGGFYLGRLSQVEYGPVVDGGKKYVEKFQYSRGGLPLKKRLLPREEAATSMANRCLTRLLVLEAIANDYEELSTVCSDVEQWLGEKGESIAEAEVLEALFSLVKDGLAEGYRLSTTPPYAVLVKPVSPHDMAGLHFLITQAGMACLDTGRSP